MSESQPTTEQIVAQMAQQNDQMDSLRQDVSVLRRERDGLRVSLELVQMELERGNVAEALKLIESTHYDT